MLACQSLLDALEKIEDTPINSEEDIEKSNMDSDHDLLEVLQSVFGKETPTKGIMIKCSDGVMRDLAI